VTPNAENVVTLPAGIELDNLEFEVEGDNLVLLLADGTEIIVLGGAANIPTFVIGDVELPQVALFAALEGSNINVAAGPDGTFSAQGGPTASRNFNDDPIDAGPEDLALADLLGDTSFGDELRTGVILGDDGDTEPTFLGAAAGGVDEDYLKNGNVNDGAAAGSASVTGSLGINWGSDDDNAAGNTGLTALADRGVAFTQSTMDALVLRALTSDSTSLVYALSANGTILTAYKDNGEGGFGEEVFVVSVSDVEVNGSYTFELLGNLDHPDGSTEDNIAIDFEFTAQDSDGDRGSSSFTVTVNDDSPVINVPTGEDGEPLVGVVEEEQREVRGYGNEDADGELDGDYVSKIDYDDKRSFEGRPREGRFVDETTNVAKGSLGISWGADDADLDDEDDIGTVASLGNRSVSFVIQDPVASEGDDSGVEVARSASTSLTSGGVPLVYEYSADGKTLTAYRSFGGSDSTGDVDKISAKALDEAPVFQIVLDDNGSGSYTFTLFRPLDHDNEGEDALKLEFQFTATDSDGDVTGPATISVVVIDDVPVLSGCDLVFTIDEDDINNALSTGTSPNDGPRKDDSYTGDPDDGNEGGPAYIQGSLTSLVKPGADGIASFSFVKGADATAALSTLTALGLSSHGDALSYRITGEMLEGYVAGSEGEGERVVFSLTLEPSGSFEFELHDQVDHDAPGDDFRERPTNSDENFDLQDKVTGDVTNINFGALIKATDGDEDSISLDGAFSIKIRDDVPEVDARTDGKLLIVDETVGSDAGDNETSADAVAALFGGVGLPGKDTDMAPQYATQQGMVTAVVKEGADDDATVTWALKLSNGKGTYSGLQTTDGRDIYLFIEGGLVVGRYDKPNDGDNDVRQPGQWDPDPAAFAIHIANDGTLSMVQYVSIKHDDRGDNDEFNDDGTRWNDSQDYGLDDSPNPIQQTLANKILAEVTVKDFDGDKATDTVEIGSRIVFQDDGPRIDIVAANDGNVVLTTLDGETIGDNVKDTAVSSAAFGSVFSIASKSFGADGAGSVSVSYALSLTGTASGLKSDGRDITLQMSHGKVLGKTSAGTVFSIEVDGSGKVTLTQFKEIDHGRSDTSGYETDLKSLADNLVKLTATATITDGDGDKHVDSAWVDLGGNIKFADHGPTVSTSASLVRVVVDEDGLLTAASDSTAAIANGTAVVGDGQASKPVTVASLMSLFNFGADGAHATEAISLKAATNEPTGLTSQSKPILISVSSDGKTLTGTADGREVFTLKLNAGGTSYTFELKDQIDHPTLSSVASGSDGAFNDAENLLSSGTPSSLLDLSQFIVGKDGDGDTVTLTAGKFVIDVRDDIPTVTSSVVEVKIDTPQIVAPVEGKVANFVLVLDTSGSVTVAALKLQVTNFLSQLADSDAQDVRVHIVQFNNTASPVGTFDLIVDGEENGAALTQALAAVNGLSGGGATNYEAGLLKAVEWIDGSNTLEVDTRSSGFDATDGSSYDQAYIIGNGSTQIAMVSGWQEPGNTVSSALNANGDNSNGWGVGIVGDANIDDGQILRFDFGAFNDFDNQGGYKNAEDFNGIPVTSATFSLDDNNELPSSTAFEYTVYFVGGGSAAGTVSVNNNDTALTIAGAGANLGKQIAYIEFTTSGQGRGSVDLQSVATPGPLLAADVNKVIFLSDGQPNAALDNSGNPFSTSSTNAINESLNEIGAIENDADGVAGPQQSFSIEAFGINVGAAALENLEDVSGSTGNATNLVGSNTLAGSLQGLLNSLAGTPGSAAPTSANFNLSPLVNVGADEGLTCSMKSGTSGLPVLQSGGVTLVYTVANNILTATAGQNGPTVFTLSLAANGSGTFTLNKPIDGQGDRDVDFSSMIQAQDFDGDAVSLAAGKFVVTVDGVPAGAPQAFETKEDESVSGTIAAIIGDDGVGQNGFSISSGPANGSLLLNTKTGEFTYTPNKNWSGTEAFSVTVTDDDGDVSAPIVVTVIVAAVADAPSLTVSSASGNEDTAISLSVSSSLTDTDSSETLKLEISDIPVGAKLTGASGQTFTATAGSTTANITGWNLSQLKITPPANSDADFTLKVHATSKETNGGDTEVVTKDLAVNVNPVDDHVGTILAQNVTVNGSVASSGVVDTVDPTQSDYWVFYAQAGQTVTITVNRSESAFDPALWLFRNKFTDPSAALGSRISMSDTGYLGFADDTISNTGPGGAPRITFKAATTGFFTLIVVNAGNANSGDGLFDYALTISGNTTPPLAADPIILDLDKNGFAFSLIDNGVTFDIDADGKGDQIAWTSDDGILAYDVDGNGLIDNGSEIFTPDFNGGKYASGVAALASLDANGDGKIDAEDDAFSKLSVWVDANNNGVSDEGELSSLFDNGVTSISLTTDQAGGTEDGQTIFAEGEFTFADGSTGNFVEVGFDTIFGSDLSDGLTVIGTDGDDILHGGMGQVVMTGGAGADTFVFDAAALDELDVADVITDFNSDEGDVLDVTALLDSLLGEQATAETAASHLRTTVEDGNTTVSVQTGADTWKDVVVLHNHDTAVKVLFDDKHAVTVSND